MEIYGIIYLLIDCTNDMEYVGQTTRSVEERFKKHKHGDQYVDRVMRAHGVELFTTAILKVCYSKEELNYWERRLIKSRDTMAPNGYNLAPGGEGGYKHTAETIAKIVSKIKGLPKTPEHRAKIAAANSGSKHHFYGKHRSVEECFQRSVVQRTGTPYKNLLAEMDARQLSYTAPAQLLGLSQATISQKMQGETRFTPKDVEKLVAFFGKPAEYLMARDDGCPAVFSETETNLKKSAAHRIGSPFKVLLAAIEKRQFTYTELAKLLGLSIASVSAKIRGKLKFTPAQMEAIKNFLGVEMSVEELFKRAE